MYELFGTLILILGFWAFWDELGNIAEPTHRFLRPDEITDENRAERDREIRENFRDY